MGEATIGRHFARKKLSTKHSARFVCMLHENEERSINCSREVQIKIFVIFKKKKFLHDASCKKMIQQAIPFIAAI